MGSKPRKKPKRTIEASALRLFELLAVKELYEEGDKMFFDMMKETSNGR